MYRFKLSLKILRIRDIFTLTLKGPEMMQVPVPKRP